MTMSSKLRDFVKLNSHRRVFLSYQTVYRPNGELDSAHKYGLHLEVLFEVLRWLGYEPFTDRHR